MRSERKVLTIIDPARCEGVGTCVRVCPHAVFEISRMSDETFASLPLLAKIKAVVHGKRTAITPNADACKACGMCEKACPERAITLVPMPINEK